MLVLVSHSSWSDSSPRESEAHSSSFTIWDFFINLSSSFSCWSKVSLSRICSSISSRNSSLSSILCSRSSSSTSSSANLLSRCLEESSSEISSSWIMTLATGFSSCNTSITSSISFISSSILQNSFSALSNFSSRYSTLSSCASTASVNFWIRLSFSITASSYSSISIFSSYDSICAISNSLVSSNDDDDGVFGFCCCCCCCFDKASFKDFSFSFNCLRMVAVSSNNAAFSSSKTSIRRWSVFNEFLSASGSFLLFADFFVDRCFERVERDDWVVSTLISSSSVLLMSDFFFFFFFFDDFFPFFVASLRTDILSSSLSCPIVLLLSLFIIAVVVADTDSSSFFFLTLLLALLTDDDDACLVKLVFFLLPLLFIDDDDGCRVKLVFFFPLLLLIDDVLSSKFKTLLLLLSTLWTWTSPTGGCCWRSIDVLLLAFLITLTLLLLIIILKFGELLEERRNECYDNLSSSSSRYCRRYRRCRFCTIAYEETPVDRWCMSSLSTGSLGVSNEKNHENFRKSELWSILSKHKKWLNFHDTA